MFKLAFVDKQNKMYLEKLAFTSAFPENIRKNIQIVDKHINRCLISVINRKMQIETTMRYHFVLTRSITKKTDKVLVRMWRN